MATTAVVITLDDSEGRNVEIDASYTSGSEPYFSRSFGNYLPGDPEDIQVEGWTVVDEGCDVAEVLRDQGRIDRAVREAAASKEEALAEDAAEATADLRAEDRP